MSQTRRGQRGSLTIDLVTGLIVLIPIVLFCIDAVVLVQASTENINVCREAARAAAAGNPTDVTPRATQVINQANLRSKGLASNFKLISVTTLGVPAQMPVNGGIMPGQVTVTSTVDVRAPFLLNAVYGGKPFTFTTFQTFPFTFLVPQSAQPN